MKLPPLPEPKMHTDETWHIVYYTNSQMQAYGQQCRAAALEEAAIDSERNGHLWSGKPAQAFFELAEQIRSLKS